MSITPPLSATSENLASRVIDFVRFPLIVFVVTMHAYLGEFTSDGANYTIANLFNLATQGITKIAVPLFFFISGYLFFLKVSHTSIVGGVSQRALHSHGRGAELARQEQAQGREHGSFPCSLYFKKLRRRFWSLFVPMAVWGTLFFLVEFLQWKFGLDILHHHRAFDGYSAIEFIRELLVGGVLAMDLTPLWFLRGLIIACLLSPLWFFLLKKFKLIPLILFGIWYCLQGIPSHSFGAVVVFYFCFGAYFSIHGIDFTKVFQKIRVLLFIAYPLLLVGSATLHFLGHEGLYDNVRHFSLIFGVAAAIALVSILLEKFPTLTFPKTLRDATFFVYAGHAFLLCLPLLLFPSLFPCKTDLGVITAFLGNIVLATAICVLLSILARRFAPWSIRFLTGGR